jgi:hypothetical protein
MSLTGRLPQVCFYRNGRANMGKGTLTGLKGGLVDGLFLFPGRLGPLLLLLLPPRLLTLLLTTAQHNTAPLPLSIEGVLTLHLLTHTRTSHI